MCGLRAFNDTTGRSLDDACYNRDLLNFALQLSDATEVRLQDVPRFLVYPTIGTADAHNLILDLAGSVVDFAGCNQSGRGLQCIIPPSLYPGYNTTSPQSSTTSPMLKFCGMTNFTLRNGTVLGGGRQWYGLLREIQLGDERGRTKPILLDMDCNGNSMFHMHSIHLYDSPYWNTYIRADNVHIHDMVIEARPRGAFIRASDNLRTSADQLQWHNVTTTGGYFHTWRNFTSEGQFWALFEDNIANFNTDGLDVIGDSGHIHDCKIDVGDDIVAVKGGKDWLVERITGSGMGLTIGSEGRSANVTFRDCWLPFTMRAIYVKAAASSVRYENISVGTGVLFPVWIGPPYQGLAADSVCPLTWPWLPYTTSTGLCTPNQEEMQVSIADVVVERSYTTPVVLFGEKVSASLESNVSLPDVSSNAATELYASQQLVTSIIDSPIVCYASQSTTLNAGLECQDTCVADGDACPAIPPCCNANKVTNDDWFGVCTQAR